MAETSTSHACHRGRVHFQHFCHLHRQQQPRSNTTTTITAVTLWSHRLLHLRQIEREVNGGSERGDGVGGAKRARSNISERTIRPCQLKLVVDSPYYPASIFENLKMEVVISESGRL
jgi:hypothetical protein